MKEIVVKQYIQVVRSVAIQVEEDDDVEFAAEVLDGMPLSADALPKSARLVSDWSYIQDSEDYEDEYGNPVNV